MKATRHSKTTKKRNPIVQRKETSSFVKPKGDATSFTPPKKESGQNKSLPTDLQSNMEASLGQDFSKVSIHTNSQEAVQMNARAYTQGENVHFAPGEFNPNSNKGKSLIGHEFTHVAQQRAGVVKPTKVLQKGVAINDSKSLEQEADLLGEKAVKGETVSKYRGARTKPSSTASQAKSKPKGSLLAQLKTALSPVQMQQLGIVQYTLATDITSQLSAPSTVDHNALINMIRNAPVVERQGVLGDSAVMTLIRSSLPADQVAAIMSELMVGSQEWDNPRSSDFYNYFVITRGTGELPTTDSMNCWESIMYAAYLAGQIDSDWIYNFYDRSGVILGSPLAVPSPTPQVWAELGWTAALPVVNSSGVVSAGDLVFYTRPGGAHPAHVAVSVGNDQVISLWEEPHGITSVQRIPIDSFPGTTLQYGPKPW